MSISLLIAGALSGPALAAEADRRNAAYTTCIFASVRQSREAATPVETMRSRMESACAAERAALRSAFIEVRTEGGKSPDEAAADWDRVHANSIEAVTRAYELRLAERGRN